jgi:hypothetical protein
VIPWGFAAAAIAAAGAVYSGMQAQQQAETQSEIMRQQAERERLQAEADSLEFKKAQNRALATRRAILGGSNVQLDAGSPLLTEQDFGGEAELQALKIRNGGEVRGTRLEQSAALTRAKGDAAMTGSYFRAGSLLVGGATDAWGGPSKTIDYGPKSNPRRYGIDEY